MGNTESVDNNFLTTLPNPFANIKQDSIFEESASVDGAPRADYIRAPSFVSVKTFSENHESEDQDSNDGSDRDVNDTKGWRPRLHK